jgi:hypothetical protein
MTRAGAVAAWTGPALIVAVVARVTSGGADAPLFVLAALTAPLLALLVPPTPRAAPSAMALPIALAVTVCVLGSSVRAVTDLGRVAGVPAWAALACAVGLLSLAALPGAPRRAPLVALGLGAAALLSAVGALGHVVHASPWTAWSRIASRSAFELHADSAWTRDGLHALAPVSLTSGDAQRITVLTAGVYRVTEHDRTPPVVREWRLASGDSLALRPGDVLTIPTDGRVRFETGARLPAPAASGTTWADGAPTSRARSIVGWTGLTVTLVGGAIAVVRPLAPVGLGGAVAAPLGVLAIVSAAAAWGLHAVDVAPELSIGMPPGASLASLTPAVVSEPWRSRVSAAVVVALVALLAAAATALRQRLGELVERQWQPAPPLLRRRGVVAGAWVVLVAVAGAAGVWVSDGWSLLVQGMGLGAATVLGPVLATRDAAGTRRASLAGAVVGAAVFVLTPYATDWLAALPADVVAVVVRYPALVAAPAAWLVATAVRAAEATRADMVAAPRRH